MCNYYDSQLVGILVEEMPKFQSWKPVLNQWFKIILDLISAWTRACQKPYEYYRKFHRGKVGCVCVMNNSGEGSLNHDFMNPLCYFHIKKAVQIWVFRKSSPHFLLDTSPIKFSLPLLKVATTGLTNASTHSLQGDKFLPSSDPLSHYIFLSQSKKMGNIYFICETHVELPAC